MNLPVTGFAPAKRQAKRAISGGRAEFAQGGDENLRVLFNSWACHLTFPF
jgi:hypothetical protein